MPQLISRYNEDLIDLNSEIGQELIEAKQMLKETIFLSDKKLLEKLIVHLAKIEEKWKKEDEKKN